MLPADLHHQPIASFGGGGATQATPIPERKLTGQEMVCVCESEWQGRQQIRPFVVIRLPSHLSFFLLLGASFPSRNAPHEQAARRTTHFIHSFLPSFLVIGVELLRV